MTAWLTIMLMVARLGGFVLIAPLFSRREIPALAKIALIWAMALLVQPEVPEPDFVEKNYMLMIISESLYGLALGWGTRVLFISYQGAGHLMEQQAGFGIATWFDPALGQTGVYSRMMGLMGLILFLALDGHYTLTKAVMSSFQLVPPGLGIASTGVLEILIHAFVASILFILRFAAPVLVVVFTVDILLGLLGKTVSQLNVLMMGLPVKSMVSMLVLLSMMPAYMNLTDPLLREIMKVLSGILEAGA